MGLFENSVTTEFNNRSADDAVPAASPAAEPVSLERALEIFDQLADRPDIAFGYSRDGCYARAHIMCRTMMDMGLTPQKAWAFEGEKPLCVQKPDGQTIRWCFHVTATLPVKTPDGNVQDMVIDPGLFDGPVSLKEWGDIMQAPAENLRIAPFGVSPKENIGDYNSWYNTTSETDKDAARTMERYLKFQDDKPRLVFQSHIRQQVAQRQMVPLQGTTWMSIRALDMAQVAAAAGPNM